MAGAKAKPQTRPAPSKQAVSPSKSQPPQSGTAVKVAAQKMGKAMMNFQPSGKMGKKAPTY
jgi:hypothetical protein